MENQEIELRQDSAMLLRARLLQQREFLKKSKSECQELKEVLNGLNQKLNSDTSRLKELENGRGALLCSKGKIRIYEFWIEIPGYSGSITGSKAKLTQHGSLQQVSEVSSKQKSGLGGGIVGGVLLGPIGAAAGVLATRKNEISTRVREVDTRKIELEIKGTGYAWSYVGELQDEEALRNIRDTINARGSIGESVIELQKQQEDIVRKLRVQLSNTESAVREKENIVNENVLEYEKAWLRYSAVRLPLLSELKFKWQCTSRPLQVLLLTLGPILLAVWAGVAIYSKLLPAPVIMSYALVFGVLHSAFIAALFVAYLYKNRL